MVWPHPFLSTNRLLAVGALLPLCWLSDTCTIFFVVKTVQNYSHVLSKVKVK